MIVTASYNNSKWYEWNLNSVKSQIYPEWRMIYIDDCSPDGTGDLVENYIQKNNLESRITLIKNQERKLALANLYNAIHSCADNEVIVILDGDDALAHNKVLTRLEKEYSNKRTWLTYGQFAGYPNGGKGFCRSMPRKIVKKNAFRKWRTQPSHLRTFYAWLFKKIEKDDLLYNGDFFPMTYDLAMMMPMIEMAQKHFKFIPEVLYLYNESNPINDHKINRKLQRDCDLIIRSRKAYKPLAKSPL